MKSVLGHKATQLITALFIFLGVILIMYPPDIEFFKKTSEFAVHLMLGMLVLSFIFLIFNQTRLMFISMLACGFLAFYLKTASNTDMILPKQNALPNVKIAHFNLSSFNKYETDLSKLIEDLDSDILAFQEYTPDWHKFLSDHLDAKFPYRHKMVRIDLFGIAIFSKKQFQGLETFYYNEQIPNINITMQNGTHTYNIISSYITPPSMKGKQLSSKGHLTFLSDYISQLTNPVITMGEFNQVYWTNDIKTFRDKSKLKNSRRNISITSKVPYDHIFYSSQLECIEFSEIKDQLSEHLGITGTFQTSAQLAAKLNE